MYTDLTYLDLNEAHDDYLEQFLVDMNMSLSNNVYLSVYYKVINRVTENFIRMTTRINCAKLHSLCLHDAYEITKHIKIYFPHTNIF